MSHFGVLQVGDKIRLDKYSDAPQTTGRVYEVTGGGCVATIFRDDGSIGSGCIIEEAPYDGGRGWIIRKHPYTGDGLICWPLDIISRVLGSGVKVKTGRFPFYTKNAVGKILDESGKQFLVEFSKAGRYSNKKWWVPKKDCIKLKRGEK